MNKTVNQLYVAVKGKGPIYEGQHVAAFTDGTSHIVIANIAKDKQTFKIKIGTEIHLYEYLDILGPICLNETELIKVLPCPQCSTDNIEIVNNSDMDVTGVHCTNCPLCVMHQELDINVVITIWNNIPRKEIDNVFHSKL